ncbi:MAG: hypothetical protein LBS00_07755 [Synergistaceae bacterium]|jgi:hypothetical protein|nr:hypothetical protein [Synergistaceae bacterium]
MQKMFSLSLLCVLLFAPAASAGEAPMNELVTDAAELFTITITLLDLEARKDSVPLMTAKLPEGQTITLEAAEHCRFIGDRGRPLSPADFAKLYRGKKVTIDFTEHGPQLYVMEGCRAGTK